MSRKNHKNKEFSESDSTTPEPETPSSAQAEEAAGTGQDPQISDATEESTSDSDSTKDDLLDEVRRSLIEQEAVEQKKQPTLWKRVTKGLKRSKKASAEIPPAEEPQQPVEVAPAVPTPPEDQTVEAPEVPLTQLDELVNLLETTQESPSVESVKEPPQKEVVERDLDELKKQAFEPRADTDVSEELGQVRSIVLEGGEEVFVEVESKTEDTSRERIDAFQNALRPYRTYIYFVMAFIGVVAVVILGYMAVGAIRQFLPARPTEEVTALPYPIGITLPGGISFNLNRGELVNGVWNPTGPEWLEGTEICRWVAIPWSLQMETVIRTLNKDDQIELTMSNNDRLTYLVYAVREVSLDELPDLDTGTPCLQLVLAKADAETRWVLTALP